MVASSLVVYTKPTADGTVSAESTDQYRQVFDSTHGSRGISPRLVSPATGAFFWSEKRFWYPYGI